MQEKDAIAAVVQEIIGAWNRHDMDAFAKAFTEDATSSTCGGCVGSDAARLKRLTPLHTRRCLRLVN